MLTGFHLNIKELNIGKKTYITNSPLTTEHLESWGRFRAGSTDVARPELPSHLREILRTQASRKILAFGRGLSYGDACINTENVTVKFNYLDRAVEFNKAKGIFTCEAGITIEEIIRASLPYGWFPPVTPGTRYPTLGGCFAANVHGKNHHNAGSFARHVRWIELMTASGDIVRCSARKNSQLFLATAGGMGLTGLIYRISLKLKRVHSAYISVENIRVRNLREMMNTLEAGDAEWEYSVSWLDCAASGEEAGRGDVILGRHAEPEQIPYRQRSQPFSVKLQQPVSVPLDPPVSLIGSLSTRLFNAVYMRKRGSKSTRRQIVSYDTFLYPLDAVRNWNRLYGKQGFVQYQFVVPFDAGYSVTNRVLEICRQSEHLPSLAVLKRLGDGDGLLSFPMPGWTLAIDIPVKRGLFKMLDELDRIVIDHGGRIYLAKDARMSPQAFRAMYPEFPQWLKIKRQVDPDDLFSSDMSRRLVMSMEDVS